MLKYIINDEECEVHEEVRPEISELPLKVEPADVDSEALLLRLSEVCEILDGITSYMESKDCKSYQVNTEDCSLYHFGGSSTYTISRNIKKQLINKKWRNNV